MVVLVGLLVAFVPQTLLAAYSYDALGRRVTATIGATTARYYYDGQNVIEERNEADVRVRYHVNGAQFIDERVATFEDSKPPAEQFTYYLLKENFSVAGTGNADGSTIERLDYSATGSFAGSGGGIDVDYNDDGYVDADDLAEFEVCASGPAIPQNDPNCAGMKLDADNDVDQTDFGIFQRCYSGTELALPECTGAGGGLPSSGTFVMHGRPVDVLPDGHTLLFVRARFYDLKNGRWLQRDPSGYAGGNNLYEGFANNPERFVDPDGRLFQELVNLWLQGRFLSNEEVQRAQASGDYSLVNARSRLLRDIRLAGGALIDPGAVVRLPQGFEQGYRQPAVRATTARFESFIFSQMEAGATLDEASSNQVLTALFFGDVTGVTQLGEGIFGVDLATNQSLTTTESVRRGVQGGSTIVIIVAGPQAMRNAGARSQQALALSETTAATGTNAVRARVLANLAESQAARAASRFELYAAAEAQITGAPRFFTAIRPGPLPASIAETFAGGRYAERTLTSERLMYRVAGRKAGPIGRRGTFLSPEPQVGGLQSQIDLALRPEWGNTATELYVLRVPAGTTIYEGAASSQGGAWVRGKPQVYIIEVNPEWILP